MHLIKLVVWNQRAIPVSVIAAAVAAIVLFVLSPSLALGQANNGPATMKECKEEMAAGRAVHCSGNSFSVKTTLRDGGYHINWSEWAGRHSNIDRTTVERLQFLYRYNFVLEVDATAVDDSAYTEPSVSSCTPRAAETDSRGIATRWSWGCKGISNVREDSSGVPTSVEQLDDHWMSTSWTGSLSAPGRKRDVPVRTLRVPGSRTDVHADDPQNPADRLTQQQVNTGSHDLLASEVEMNLYLITVHFDDGTSRRSYELITGGPFDDR